MTLKSIYKFHMDTITYSYAAICILVHAFYLFFFWNKGIKPLVIVNVFSLLLYICTLFFKGDNREENSIVTMFYELAYYSFFASVILGFENGFYLFSIPIPAESYQLISNRKRATKLIVITYIAILCSIPLAFIFKDTFAEYRMIMEPYNMKFVISCLLIHVSSMITYGMMYIDRNNKNVAEIQYRSEHDALTDVYNRVFFNQYLKNKKEKQGCFIMFDIDNFKKINDRYGHDIGDKALVKVAHTVRDILEPGDIIVRWGGEEFVILTTVTMLEQAKAKAETIRSTIESIAYDGDKKLTITLGVTKIAPDESFETALKHVDENLYEGKTTGKNKVVAK